jgi:predicted Fe-Mo cluster-binding NifX family protein
LNYFKENKGKQKMKIALSAQEPSMDSIVDPRFGRAKFFIVFDTEHDTFEALDNEQNLLSGQGAGIQSAATVVNAGCNVLITGHCGPKAFTALNKTGVAVYAAVAGVTVREAVDSFKKNELVKLETADVEGHW